MDDNHRITVDISPELASIVSNAVESGQYASADEVVTEALRAWSENQAFDPSIFPPITMSEEEHDAWFRAEVQKALDGLENGTAKVLTHEEQMVRWNAKRADLLAKAGQR